MSVSAAILRILVDGGKDIEEAITVARAMERGDDARAIYKLVDDLEALNSTDEVIAIAICGLAESINKSNHRAPRICDEHSEARDSNRSRRGMPDNQWRALREEIFDRDGHECQYCGATEDLTCDHIVPLVRGGTNEKGNLTTACRPCNSSKGDRPLDEWLRLVSV